MESGNETRHGMQRLLTFRNGKKDLVQSKYRSLTLQQRLLTMHPVVACGTCNRYPAGCYVICPPASHHIIASNPGRLVVSKQGFGTV